MNTSSLRFASAASLALLCLRAVAADDLASGFAQPPDSAKPHTWWHWMNGNVTKEGITADLEAMKRIGLGGAQIFNVSEEIPEGPIAYNSPQWREMVKHAAAEAQRLGLELCIHNCAGWSSSGGPWVQPQDAMQTLVTSETRIHGPARFTEKLAQPRTNHNYYRDIAVLAFPTPANDAARIPDIKAKALYEYKYGLQPSLDAAPAGAAIARGAVVDLSAKFKDGTLAWEAPAGDWTVLRIGHTPTGAVNAPSPVPGRGLEVDKLSREAFEHYWAGGMEPLIKELGPLAGASLRSVLVDSYEVGCQNWSPRFREEFLARRGYDPLLLLPVITGRYIENADTSERFLWDLRRTVGDLFADNYYTAFAQTCRKNGLLSSVEPYDGPFECTQVGSEADIIMGEFWVNADMRYSVKLAASVAHVFGKSIVGAESFTAAPGAGRWLNHPASLKAVGDLMFAEGINRCIIHRYAHQPWLNIEPGMTMGQWGTHFERTNTWWEHGGPQWVQYLTRSQFMLQQGRFAADVLYLAGESAPNGAPHHPELKALGYDYDSCGPDALRNVSVKDGSIVLASGMAYRVLVLPDTPFMTPALLDRIATLAQSGATIIGPAPKHSPSLRDAPADAALQGKAQGLWHVAPQPDSAPLPAGAVWSDLTVERALSRTNTAPDALFTASVGGTPNVAWIHRTVGDTDIYFISNQKPRSQEITCSFRVRGKAPELWSAESGAMQPAPLWHEQAGRTAVTMNFEPSGSAFIIMRPGSGPTHAASLDAPSDPTRATPKVLITKAMYEATDGAGGVDVTAKVAAMVAAGNTQIPATNAAFGDPTYNHQKRLRIEYTIDGKAVTRQAPENSTLELYELGPDRPAPYELFRTAEGVELRTSQPGTFTVRTADGSQNQIGIASIPTPIEVTGPWTVAFQGGRGAPASITLDALASWTKHSDAGVRYFSGTATYEKDIDLPAATTQQQFILDLGEVRDIAEIYLNGKPVATRWKAPFATDITPFATPGKNHLTVKITNMWVNRLIGDEQLPEDTQWARATPSPLHGWPQWFAPQANSAAASIKDRPTKERLTFTTWKHWQKDSPLLDSGLIGPVYVRTAERRPVTGR